MSTETVPAPAVTGRARAVDRELSLAVARLRTAFGAAPLPLPLRESGSVSTERSQVVDQMDDYLLPRLEGPGAPALVVVGGPTGVGKSTLVNSLAGRRVTTPGLLRPTTRSPVLVHHPDDRDWFGPDRILPTLDRVDHATSDHGAIQLVGTPSVPRGLAILDAPDFDSIDDANRELATKLLAAADLWLFVTSSARYADEVPWQQLSIALARDAATAVVMNRIPVDDRATVTPHLSRMLTERGIRDQHVFFVEHGPVDESGRLPAPYVADIRDWLHSLAADVRARSAAVQQTVGGAVRRAVVAAASVADAAVLQVEAVSELLTIADRSYGVEVDLLRGALGDGSLLRGELRAQWAELFHRYDVPPLAETVGAVHDLRARSADELQTRVDRLVLALDLTLETLVVDHAERAAAHASADLRATSHGSALLDWSADDLSRPGRGLGTRTRKSIAAVRRRLVARVAEQLGGDGGLRDQSSRALAVTLVLHAITAPVGEAPEDPTGAALHGLLVQARDDVVRATTSMLAAERDRYLRPVLDWNLAPDAPDRLRAAARDAARALLHYEADGSRSR
ncbi:GTPase [Nocardioides sp. MH1]|uniref:GTPase n=1 Tax=Nocardioides sp. MH1 TaxID=3242490 RepID=UPI00351FCE51